MSEEASRTHDVFLSYSSKDKNWADAACAVLERHRARCWIAPRDITPGEEWGAAIIRGINGSRIMVLIFSGHANASGQVRREVERAISQGMTVLAMRVEDVYPEGSMEYALGNTHWLDAFAPPVERQLEKLARSVKTLLASDAEPPEGTRVAGDEPPNTKANPRAESADTGESRRPRAFWPMVIAASLFGLVALSVIVSTIRTRNGETKITVPSDSSNQVDRGGKIVEQDPSRNGPASDVNKTAESSGAKLPIPPPQPKLIPAAGLARLTKRVPGGVWIVEGDQFIQNDPGGGGLRFGDEGWSDYDFPSRRARARALAVCVSISAVAVGAVISWG